MVGLGKVRREGGWRQARVLGGEGGEETRIVEDGLKGGCSSRQLGSGR